MNRLITLVLLAAAIPAGAQQPSIQNGRIETRTGTSIERELTAVGGGPDPVWVAWRVPMVDGDRHLCSSWNDGSTFVRGEVLENRAPGVAPPMFAPPAGPMRLEGGTQLVVLARMLEGRLERLRAVDDTCPIDAGARTVYWLSSVTAGESVRYLDGLAHAQPLNIGATRRLAESALMAIGLHRDPAATAALDRMTGADVDRSLRRQAAQALASTRGAHGLERVSALLKDERDRDQRQALVGALAESTEPAAADALLALARTDADANVRGEAGYRYIRRAGPSGLSGALSLINTDRDDQVKRRVVSGLSSLPAPAGTAALIELARTNPNLVVRKEAVSALSRSRDPRAVGFLEEIVGR